MKNLKLLKTVKNGDIYKKVLENFPDAEMIDLKFKEDD